MFVKSVNSLLLFLAKLELFMTIKRNSRRNTQSHGVFLQFRHLCNLSVSPEATWKNDRTILVRSFRQTKTKVNEAKRKK